MRTALILGIPAKGKPVLLMGPDVPIRELRALFKEAQVDPSKGGPYAELQLWESGSGLKKTLRVAAKASKVSRPQPTKPVKPEKPPSAEETLAALDDAALAKAAELAGVDCGPLKNREEVIAAILAATTKA